MGVLAQIKERRSLANPDARLLRLFGVVESASGIAVNEKTALGLSAWWACIQVISEDVGGMPLLVYKRLDSKGKERAINHPLYDVLHNEPNPEMTPMTFWQTLTGHVCSWGNAYAEIEFDNSGFVRHLWPLRPDHTWPERKNGSIQYKVTVDGKGYVLPPERVLHIVGLSFNGLKGYSPTQMAMETIGLGLAAEKFGSVLFKNNARPGGYLRHPAKLSKEAQERLIESFEARSKGLDNAHRLAVLEEGMEFQEVGMPPEAVQFLLTRQHQVEEVCRWHRMQPHKIQHLLRATFSNIEQQSLEHWGDTIQPYCIRGQQELTRKCLTRKERQTFFVEYLPDAILRMDTKGKYEAYAVGRQWGWLSANDVRERENMNPVEGGDLYFVPLNMVPAESVKEIPAGGEKPPAKGPTDSRGRASGERGGETRAASGEVRRRLSEAYLTPFEQAFARILKREKGDILRGAEQAFGQRDQTDFVRWAREYYDDMRTSGRVGNELWGLYLSFAQAIQSEAALEIAGTVGMTPELETFMRQYIEAYVARHTSMSMASVLEAIGKPDGDPLELLKVELDSWNARPAIDAKWEAYRAANAVARETWRSQGITHIRWQTQGDNCPYCNHMNGKVVGIEETFARKGEHVNDPENPDNWMSFSSDFHHPPIHAGCDCTVVAA